MNKILAPIIAAIGILSLIALYYAGAAYQSGSLDLGGAFGLMRQSAIAGAVGAVLAIVFMVWRRPRGVLLGLLVLGTVMGALAFYLPWNQQRIAQSVPPIHDITTDTVNPPAFVDIVPLRAEAPNPAEYAGAETAELQRAAYPDLQAMEFNDSVVEVFAAAMEVVDDMGWELVANEAEEGRIEATATTRWFGFKDDVVIRIQDMDMDGTRVDVRSKSRVGRSDVGANAARIRAFREALTDELD